MNQKIGDLNGRWALAFKAATILTPIVWSICGWAFLHLLSVDRAVAGLEAKMPSQFPPQETLDRLDRIERRIDESANRLDAKIERNMESLNEVLRLLATK